MEIPRDDQRNVDKMEVGDSTLTIEYKAPDWFRTFAATHLDSNENIQKAVDDLEGLNLDGVKEYLGGSFEDLPYEVVEVLFVKGTDEAEVATILTKMRTEHHKKHPELEKNLRWFIGPRGNVVLDNGKEKSPAWLRSICVDDSCIHFKSGVPGMDDTDSKEVLAGLSDDTETSIELF